MVWTEEDIEKVRKFIDIKNKGHYADTHELTSVYNRVLEKNVTNTTCGSCLRQRVEELERALRKYEAEQKKAEEIKEEETKEENNDGDNTKSHKTKGRKKKQESAE